MGYLIKATNSRKETLGQYIEDEDTAKKVFEAMRFMCIGTNMTVYLFDPDGEIIEKWDMPKGARYL